MLTPIDQCEPGRLYAVRCRNFSVAVYAGAGAFLGLREKFYARFLFAEYHGDQGAPYGTVRDAEPLPVRVPADIPLRSSLGPFCQVCGAEAARDAEAEAAQKAATGAFFWTFIHDGCPVSEDGQHDFAYRNNDHLEAFLRAFDAFNAL